MTPSYELLEQEPPARSGGVRVLTVLAGVALAALIIPRLLGSTDEPIAEPPPSPPVDDAPVASAHPASSGPGEPIGDAPLQIRMIELVAASRLALFHGQLGDGQGPTTVPNEAPYATDAVSVLVYGAGVVVGPTPGASVPGVVRVFGVDVPAPAAPVEGIFPAIGGGYWFMDTERSTAGACQMHLVMMSGELSPRSVTHPCDFVPEQETVDGFVGRIGSGALMSSGYLFDPDTGALSSIDGVLLGAAERSLVRWAGDISNPPMVEDLVSGHTFDVVLPPGRVTRQVELNQDERYLAVVLVERLASLRSYEVWVYDLFEGGSRMATVTTLDGGPLELAWRGDVLIVVGNDVEAYDAGSGKLYRSDLEPPPNRLDAIAMSFALQ